MTVDAVLAAVPADRRSPAVLALMADAAKLGPSHAAYLVGWVAENWPKLHPARPLCACGAAVTNWCPKCPKCIDLEERRG